MGLQQFLLDFGRVHIRVGLVQPAGLRHAHAFRSGTARHQPQQGDLPGQRELLLQTAISWRAPENQAAGEGQQVQPAGQVIGLDLRRKQAERAEGQQVANLVPGGGFIHQELACPAW